MAGNANSGRGRDNPFAAALRMELLKAGEDHKALRLIAAQLIEKASADPQTSPAEPPPETPSFARTSANMCDSVLPYAVRRKAKHSKKLDPATPVQRLPNSCAARMYCCLWLHV